MNTNRYKFRPKHSEETKQKMSKTRLKRKVKLGYINSLKTRKKMSESKKNKISNVKGKHYKLSEKTKKRMSESRKGNKSYLWQGGITLINYAIRNSRKYKKWRDKVFKRDDWTCQECSKESGNFQVHHIKPFSTHPKLRFNMSNGITLCKKCHYKKPSGREVLCKITLQGN